MEIANSNSQYNQDMLVVSESWPFSSSDAPVLHAAPLSYQFLDARNRLTSHITLSLKTMVALLSTTKIIFESKRSVFLSLCLLSKLYMTRWPVNVFI